MKPKFNFRKSLRNFPFILSSLILAAHFYRNSQNIALIICLLIPFLLLAGNKQIRAILRLSALCGSFIWFKTTYDIYQFRLDNNLPWIRMVIILSAVAVFTALSGYWLRPFSNKE